MRISPDELSLASPKAAREMLAAGKGFRKSMKVMSVTCRLSNTMFHLSSDKTDFYWVFPPPENPDIFTEIREDVHAVLKRHASGPYSMATMQTMTGYIEDTQRLFASKLDKMSTTKDRYCNLGDYLHYYAFDVLGEIAFSRKFGFLDAGYDLENVIKTIDDVQWYDGIVGQIPEWDYMFRRNPIRKHLPSFSTGNFLITRMALEELGKRKKFGNQIERKDLLSQLFDAHDKAPDAFKEMDVFAIAHGAM